MNTTTAPLTLRQFFSLTELPAEKLSEIESSEKVSSIKESLAKQAKGVGWGLAQNEIVKKLEELLDINISDILVAAWNKYQVLLKYTDRTKYPPNETFLVPLAEHTVTSEHHPYLEIMVEDQPVGRIDFDVLIALKLKGIILKVQDAKIMEIHTGTCKGKGTIKCEGLVIFAEETDSVPLPGSFKLGRGVPIVP
jgi:hypothetical protein